MENYRKDMLKTLLEVLKFDGEQGCGGVGAPFGKGNRECLDYMLRLCESLGMSVKNLDGYAGFADIGEGEAFGILGHLDTVPVSDGWTKNPYGEIDDGIIYGRGVLDDRGPMVACVYALKALLDEGLKPKRKIRFIFGCNEESGWECIDHYRKHEQMPEEGFSPDADFPVINCEKGIATLAYTKEYDGKISLSGGTRPNVVPSECNAVLPMTDENLKAVIEGRLDYEIKDNKIYATAHGKAAHAANPQLGENAIVKMLKALRKTDKDFDELYNAFSSFDGSGCGLDLCDEISGALTLNLGLVDCDASLSFILNIRYPVTVTETQIINILDNCIPCYIVAYSVFQPPLFVDKDDDLVKTLLKTYNDVTGQNAEAVTIGGGTYARALKKGVAFGPEFPGKLSTIHMPDERVSIDDFMTMAKIYYTAIKSLCF